MSQLTLSQFSQIHELTRSQREVLLAMRRAGRASMRDIAVLMGVPLHRISGRFSELVDKGCLIKVGKKGRFTIYEVMMWPTEG